MLNGNDKDTFYALRLLRDVVDKRQKPIIIWAGAGVSKWCGFPTWQETAGHFHASYRRSEAQYDRIEGQRLIEEAKLPELFEVFRRTNPRRYNQELTSLFGARVPTPVYGRFLNIIKPIAPLQIVTTNVDETLERNLPAVTMVQKTDLERCLDHLPAGTSFVAKLHGSVSSVQSTVFTTTDYQALIADAKHQRIMEELFAQAIVVFVGYSLRDKYVLELFEGNSNARQLFGDGPHFVVQSTGTATLPESIKTIRYLPEPHGDHRSAITVLDIIRVVRDGGHVWFAPDDESPRAEKKLASACFISDVIPPGTWTSSQSLVLAGKAGFSPNAIVGQGFDDSELPQKTSPAMHDVVVGLVSFDYVYVPLWCASRLHDLLGSPTFWELVKCGIFRFVYYVHEPVVMFRSADAVDCGAIGMVRRSAEDGRPFTVDEQIRKQIQAVPGREAEAERLFETLAAGVSLFDHARFNIPSLTRGALLHPSVQKLLGISDSVLPTSFPRWARFPVLRLAHTIMAGCACENFTLAATKIGFGSEILVGAAFAVAAARDWADNVSSYVLTSRFNTDLGAYVESDPSVLKALMAFRDTQAGVDLRREILEELATSAGSEFTASVNAGLRSIVPSTVMENARDQLSGLLFRNDPDSAVVPAVWTNIRNSDSIARLWRARSRKELEEYCRLRGIRERDLCPCGSGDKLRSCCAQALNE
jgi:NAD-dependent SIR2 family protein deacetylase